MAKHTPKNRPPHGPLPQRQQQTVAVQQSTYREGPLPDPNELAGYDRLLPGAAERIFATFEKQSAHRIEMEKSVVLSEIAIKKRGQIFAFLIVVFAIATAVVLILTGHGVQGFATVLTTITVVAGLFTYGKVQENKNQRGE